MRKFFQWTLLTIVGVGLLVVIIHQCFTVTTGRARDASVEALKEKLESFEPSDSPADTLSTAEFVVVKDGGARPESGSNIDLRARWQAVFNGWRARRDSCELQEETWDVAVDLAMGIREEPLSEEERDALTAHQACMADLMEEVLSLSEQTPDLGQMAESMDWRNDDTVANGFWACAWLMRTHLILSTAVEDHVAAVRAVTALANAGSKRSAFRTLHEPAFMSITQNYWVWEAIEDALQSGTVAERYWDNLLFRLKQIRRHAVFSESVKRDIDWQLHYFENWRTANRDLTFREEPITFLRTWAYPRITTALFNHDVDRFSRAMEVLLDLSRLPYYECREELDVFCDEFDVEPAPHKIKVLRGNPGWYYVLWLSRVGLEAGAKQEAALDLMQFAILLDRHRRTTGQYPETLEALSPHFGGEIPVSPLDGESYLYERLDHRYRLGFREEWVRHLVEEYGYDSTYVRTWHDPLISPFEGIDLEEGEE